MMFSKKTSQFQDESTQRSRSKSSPNSSSSSNSSSKSSSKSRSKSRSRSKLKSSGRVQPKIPDPRGSYALEEIKREWLDKRYSRTPVLVKQDDIQVLHIGKHYLLLRRREFERCVRDAQPRLTDPYPSLEVPERSTRLFMSGEEPQSTFQSSFIQRIENHVCDRVGLVTMMAVWMGPGMYGRELRSQAFACGDLVEFGHFWRGVGLGISCGEPCFLRQR